MDPDEPQQEQNSDIEPAKPVRFGAEPRRRFVPEHGYAPVTSPLGPLPDNIAASVSAPPPTADLPVAPAPEAEPESARFILPAPLKKAPRPLRQREPRQHEEASAPVALDADFPVPGPGADLANPPLHWGWKVGVFLATLIIYVALVPRFLDYSSPPTGDQPFYLMDTISLTQDFDLNVANNYAQSDFDKFYKLAPHSPDFIGMSAPYPLPEQLAPSSARPITEKYSFHLPGLPVLLIPSWTIGSWFELWWPATVVFMCVLGSLLMLNIFLLSFEMTGKVWIAIAVWLPLAFSNPIMSFSYLLFTELAVGLFLVYAFRRLAQGWASNSLLRILFVGIVIAYVPWLAWRCVILAGPVILYGIVQWARDLRLKQQAAKEEIADAGAVAEPGTPPAARAKSPLNRSLVSLFLFVTPMVVSAIGIMSYNKFLFGTLIPDGKVPELGDASPFHFPWQGIEQFKQTVFNTFALFFDRQSGLLTSAPIYLLAFVGIIALVRSPIKQNRRLLIWILVIILPYFGVIASFVFWNGIWGPPARYFTSMVPFLAAPLAMSLYALRRSPVYLALFAVLSLPGIAIMAIRMYDARIMWPANTVYDWIKLDSHSPIHLDIAGLLPAFDPLDDLHLPVNTAWIILASLAIVVISYVLMVRNKAAQPFATRHWAYPMQAATWIVVIVLLGGGWYTANFDALLPRTDYTEIGRWQSDYAFMDPGGMTYLDGSVYVVDFDPDPNGNPGNLVRLDLSTGQFAPVQPTFQGLPSPFINPDDVRAGSDGLLYVVDNDNKNAQVFLYAMNGDGAILKKIPVTSNTGRSAGIAIGPDNSFYVADMPASQIYHYSPDGGAPLARYGGQTGGLNNTVGITIHNGKMYVAEMSAGRLQVLDASNGQFIRDYKLKCPPQYVVFAPGETDWMDIACGDDGMVSINEKTGLMQNDRYINNPPNGSVRSAVYGPDGTLYLMTPNQLVAYKVKH